MHWLPEQGTKNKVSQLLPTMIDSNFMLSIYTWEEGVAVSCCFNSHMSQITNDTSKDTCKELLFYLEILENLLNYYQFSPFESLISILNTAK